MISKINGKGKTIGQVLVEMGACTKAQILAAVTQYDSCASTRSLGDHLVALGCITQAQLDAALSMQRRLQSTKKHVRALAMSDVAAAASASSIQKARELRQFATDAYKSITRTHAQVAMPKVAATEGK